MSIEALVGVLDDHVALIGVDVEKRAQTELGRVDVVLGQSDGLQASWLLGQLDCGRPGGLGWGCVHHRDLLVDALGCVLFKGYVTKCAFFLCFVSLSLYETKKTYISLLFCFVAFVFVLNLFADFCFVS